MRRTNEETHTIENAEAIRETDAYARLKPYFPNGTPEGLNVIDLSAPKKTR